jgi:hypothetical protein
MGGSIQSQTFIKVPLAEPQRKEKLPSKSCVMKKKSPTLAAVLSLVFGPLGYLYIGWRYAVMALAVFLIFVFVLMVTDFLIPEMRFVTLGILAWKAFIICSVRNQLIETGDEDIAILNSFPVAAMAMSDLLVGMGRGYAVAVGLYVTVRLLLDGSVLNGLFLLLLGTPALVWIASIVFGFIALGIDALFAKGGENLFRR